MQIVINIPDEKYERLPYIDQISLRDYIANGTLLPKGHGRLIDADDLDNHIIGHVDTRSCPTIIEADQEGEDEKGDE